MCFVTVLKFMNIQPCSQNNTMISINLVGKLMFATRDITWILLPSLVGSLFSRKVFHKMEIMSDNQVDIEF